jgi:XTP/dITP diphosphohydrolase
VLFSIINYARFLEINPENALERTNRKFIKRFIFIEQKAQQMGKKVSELNPVEMESFWEAAKQSD